MQRVFDFFLRLWAGIADFLGSVLASLPTSTEFWSGIIGAVVGAVVGGAIAYLVQLRALRETRDQRREDHLRVLRGLANALLFKVIRVHSDFYGIHRHIEDAFDKAEKDNFQGEPWQFVLPLANFPDAVHFSPDEMGMVLGLKNDDVFNRILSLDVIHNSLIDATKIMSTERRALAERLNADDAKGSALSGSLDRATYFALKPRMIEVNSLIADTRTNAKRDVAESLVAMDRLHKLLKEQLGLAYNIEPVLMNRQANP